MVTGSGPAVLDASALIALLADEPGADEVSGLITGSLMSAVNLTEVLQWGICRGEVIDTLPSALRRSGLGFTTERAGTRVDLECISGSSGSCNRSWHVSRAAQYGVHLSLIDFSLHCGTKKVHYEKFSPRTQVQWRSNEPGPG